MAEEEVLDGRAIGEDGEFDERIRPERLDDFPGQEAIKEKLRISIAAAKAVEAADDERTVELVLPPHANLAPPVDD